MSRNRIFELQRGRVERLPVYELQQRIGSAMQIDVDLTGL